MRSTFQYIRPTSLDEVLFFLTEHGARTALIAGGTDLSIAIRKGDLYKDYVLDVSRLDEIRTVELSDGILTVGAGLTFTEIIRHPLVVKHAPVLAAAAACVGSLQIRNMGTIGGNVANASPAADSVPAMMVHNARVRIQSAESDRPAPLEEVITGPYTTNLQPGEMITRFLLEPMPPVFGFGIQRVARRRSLAIARINAAAMGTRDSDGTVVDFRLSIGSIMPRPCRLKDAENHLKGKALSFNVIREAAEMVSREMISKSGTRPSTEYKKPAVEGLVLKIIAEVFRDSLS